jgi:hypothetical protein
MVVCVAIALLLASTDVVQSRLLPNLQGKPGQGYTLKLDVGSSQQPLSVLIDTGSSSFVVAGSPLKLWTQYFRVNR